MLLSFSPQIACLFAAYCTVWQIVQPPKAEEFPQQCDAQQLTICFFEVLLVVVRAAVLPLILVLYRTSQAAQSQSVCQQCVHLFPAVSLSEVEPRCSSPSGVQYFGTIKPY